MELSLSPKRGRVDQTIRPSGGPSDKLGTTPGTEHPRTAFRLWTATLYPVEITGEGFWRGTASVAENPGLVTPRGPTVHSAKVAYNLRRAPHTAAGYRLWWKLLFKLLSAGVGLIILA